MTAYPTDLPLAEIKSVIDIVRAGEIVSRKSDFAHDVWVVQGYAQRFVLGSPPDISLAQAVSEECEDPVAQLEKVVASASDEASTQSLSDINWKAILQWAIKMLLQVLV